MQISKFGKVYNIKWWNKEILNTELITLDTETELIRSPDHIPNVILTTAYDGSNNVYIIKNNQLQDFIKLHVKALFGFWNAAFDIPVLEKYISFDSHLLNNKILDGQLLYRSLNIATLGMEAKKWSLDYVTEQFTKEVLEKDDNIRLTFGQYLNSNVVQYDSISNTHLIYACLDPIATYICTKHILTLIKSLPTSTNLAHNINLVGDIALAQVTRNGICIDLEYMNKIKQNFELDIIKNSEILNSYGYYKGKKGNTKIIEQICKQENFILPITEKGKQSYTKLSLEPYKNHAFINAYLQFKGFSKQQNFLNDLNSSKVYPRYNSLKVTSRTSCTRPNIQNMPRIGGIRECFIPSPGNIFIDCDYTAIELAAIASINLKLFKYSIMADLLNKGQDLHTYAASKIYKINENEVTKQQRQTAKILNFGLVANMAPITFVHHAANFGVAITLEESIWLKEEWGKVFPEMIKYWKRGYGKDTVIFDTGFIRAGCSYTEYLNCPMQGKVIEGAKLALYMLIKSGYHVVAFIHDQIIIDHPIESAKEALENVKQIMIEAMQKVIINVKINVTGDLKTRFEK